IVHLCSVCLHSAETKPDCLCRDHLGSVSAESDSAEKMDFGSSIGRVDTLPIKVKVMEYQTLKQLVEQLKRSLHRTFENRFGTILDLMEVEIQPEALTSLEQFFDPPLRSFLFQDFQMAPTLDEYERILD
ncbi:hypothetical protein CR513_38360, partial [Mucuna pruriens]